MEADKLTTEKQTKYII